MVVKNKAVYNAVVVKIGTAGWVYATGGNHRGIIEKKACSPPSTTQKRTLFGQVDDNDDVGLDDVATTRVTN